MPPPISPLALNLPTFTVSDVLPYYDCNYKGAVRYSSQRWVEPTGPMRRGSALHTYVENLLKTQKPDHKFLDETVPADLRDEVEPLIVAADMNLCPPPFKVIGVEVPFRTHEATEGYEFYMNARLDAIIEAENGVYSGQIKTLGKGVPLGPFLERVRLSPHEAIYRRALRSHGYNVLGTVLLTFRTYLTKEQRKNNVPVFEFFYLPATEEEDTLIANDVHRLIIQLIYYTNSNGAEPGILRTRYPPIRNWTACTGIHGTCPLYEHCHNRASVQSCLPSPLVNRYPEFPRYTPPSTTRATVPAAFSDATELLRSISAQNGTRPNQRPR